ncbi:MAG: c-type cytochrome [Betaproteobacteria bacterium]|nr:c-type cytochrome [Betaproteobacteria bacterium]
MTTMPALLITVTLTGLLMSMASAQTSTNPEPDAQLRALLATPGDPARGKKAFATCEGCHRKNASGRSDGTIPRLTGQHASVVVKQVLDIRAGRRSNPSMQPFVVDPAFTMTHLVDIAAYLQALPFEGSIGKGPGTDLARGKELYERDCAACHGASGQGDAAKFYPMVSAQHYRYLLREVIAIRDGSRGNSNPEMVKVVKAYTPAEIEAVSDYMSQMAPPKP